MMDMFINVYLPHFFNWLIETSIMASILVVLILCVKLLFRNQLNPRWQYLLWMILIVRLLLPWSFSSTYSIYSIFSNGNGTAVTSFYSSKEHMKESTNIDYSKVAKEDSFVAGSTQVAKENKKQSRNSANQNDVTFSFYTILIYIWLTGVIILGFTTIIINRRLLHFIKKQPMITDQRIVTIFENCKKSMSVQQKIPLFFAGNILSPTVVGFIRPKVLLSGVHSKVLNEQQLRYIFLHELAHIKRRDVGMNWLMYGLLILNWFNPILWYAYSCMREDQELACDSLALTYINSEEQLAYGHTIISLLEHYSNFYQIPSLANLSRNKKTLKRRILMIKKFKNSYRWSVFGVATLIAVSSISLVNARVDKPTNAMNEHTELNEEKGKTEVVQLSVKNSEPTNGPLTEVGQWHTVLNGIKATLVNIKQIDKTYDMGAIKFTIKSIKFVQWTNLPEFTVRKFKENHGKDLNDELNFIEIYYKVENTTDKDIVFYPADTLTMNNKTQIKSKDFYFPSFDSITLKNKVVDENYIQIPNLEVPFSEINTINIITSITSDVLNKENSTILNPSKNIRINL
ncbi:M56 family metallopeptidase [Lysinibacillus sp. Ag94]|nr:M56 family metallopeptidase [Lysinibacillus sp. Ag94]UPW81461.1 M56 family metallopeptidase [Lysinibacillus sp. Ag94]